MICACCGLSHPCTDFHATGNDRLPDCVHALVLALSETRSELRHCQLVSSKLYEACKTALIHLHFPRGVNQMLRLAVQAAEEELCHQTTARG